jgi:hypothetical protein
MGPHPKQGPTADIIRRLDLIIALLLDRPDPQSASNTTDRIVRLGELGASPAQIAQILNKPLNHVTASIAMRRKAKHRG